MTTLNITQAQINKAIGDWLISFLPTPIEVIVGQTNRVPQPVTPDFCIFWPILRERMGTNIDTYDMVGNTFPTTSSIETDAKLTIQIDVHGPASTDTALLIMMMARDPAGQASIDSSIITPLYADDPQQMPFINGENQYEDRWVVKALFQANFVVVTPQQFADILTASTFQAD